MSGLADRNAETLVAEANVELDTHGVVLDSGDPRLPDEPQFPDVLLAEAPPVALVESPYPWIDE